MPPLERVCRVPCQRLELSRNESQDYSSRLAQFLQQSPCAAGAAAGAPRPRVDGRRHMGYTGFTARTTGTGKGSRMNTPGQAPDMALPAHAAAADAALIASLQRGDERAFVLLIDRYHTQLVRMAMLYVGDWAVAEEVVQET